MAIFWRLIQAIHKEVLEFEYVHRLRGATNDDQDESQTSLWRQPGPDRRADLSAIQLPT